MSIKPRDDFFVTLPSNVLGHPENTPSNYTTTLPTPLELSGSWEVALLETHYFKHWGLVKEPKLPKPPKLAKLAKLPKLPELPKLPDNFRKSLLVIFTNEYEGEREHYIDEQQNLREFENDSPSHDINQLPKPLWNRRDRVHYPDPSQLTDEENNWLRKALAFQSQHKKKTGIKHGLLTIENSHYENILTLAQEIAQMYPDMGISVELEALSGKLMFQSTAFQYPKKYIYFLTPDSYLMNQLGYNWCSKMVDDMNIYIARMDRQGDIKATLEKVPEQQQVIPKPEEKDEEEKDEEEKAEEKETEIQSIFVYSDIVDYQIVGNTMATLMGVLPTKGAIKEPQSWQFNPLQYLPIQSNNISTITMKLCTPQGDPVQFLSGDSLCRLHFRRKLL